MLSRGSTKWIYSFGFRFMINFSILVNNLNIARAQGQFRGPYCGTETGNSAFKQDLNNALNSLTGTNNGFGFFNSKSGQANAAALCRGDIETESCRKCVDDGSRILVSLCLDPIEAAGWLDDCLVRYSNRSMGYGVDDVVLPFYNQSLVSNSSYNLWNRTVTSFLGALRPEAADGGQLRKYASGNVYAPGLETIYGYMQCSPDLSAAECDSCLVTTTEVARVYGRSLGVEVYKPGCVLRYQIYSFFNSTWYPVAPPSSGHKKTISIEIIVGPILATVVVIAIVIFICRLRLKHKRKAMDLEIGALLPELQARLDNVSPEDKEHERENEDTGDMDFFNLSTILLATNNFSVANKLGEGGFGPVYKGELQDGKEIAVKRLSSNSGQGVKEFKTEVQLIIKLQHKNLVRLLGYCIKGTERILIYEFMANNSLETFLFDPTKCKELDWGVRVNIVRGIAKGLRYLHEDSRLKIIHRDMKASNILLDHEMKSKISDFGTARIFGGNQMEANTNRIVGTYGYMAPEYAMEGIFSTKSDVYSFGVLLLEIVTGQRNNRFCFEDKPQNFLSTAWRLWKANEGEKLLDWCLYQNYPIVEALRWINIALLCVQEDPQDRPSMSNVVIMLEGQWSTSLPLPSEPPLSFARFAAVFEKTTTASDVTVTTSDTIAHPPIDVTSSDIAAR